MARFLLHWLCLDKPYKMVCLAQKMVGEGSRCAKKVHISLITNIQAISFKIWDLIFSLFFWKIFEIFDQKIIFFRNRGFFQNFLKKFEKIARIFFLAFRFFDEKKIFGSFTIFLKFFSKFPKIFVALFLKFFLTF